MAHYSSSLSTAVAAILSIRVGKHGKRAASFAAAASLLAASSPASAAFICHVYPATMLGIAAGGEVLVDVEGVHAVKICSVSSDAYSVSKDACQAWYSALLTWGETNKSGLLYFNPASTTGSATTCSQLQPWMPAGPYYLEAG